MLTSDSIRRALDALDLTERVAVVHSSMRSFEPRVDASELLREFAAARMTILMPAFSHVHEVRPSEREQLETNGRVYGEPVPCGSVPVFDVAHLDVDRSMGALPSVAVRQGALRGNHPFNGFCAVGPSAADALATQSPERTYGPLEWASEASGSLVLIGVDLRAATVLHLAERMAGRRHFVRWFCDGNSMRPARVGSCSYAFDDFQPHLPVPTQVRVGGARWALYDLQTVLERAVTALAHDPFLGLCDRTSCERCPIERSRISRW